MPKACFAADYAYLPTAQDLSRTVSNPGELLKSDALKGLLRLCGINEREINASASDYELFSAFCKGFSMLSGHPTYEAFRAFWKKYFPSLAYPDATNAEVLWREITDLLTQSPKKLCDFWEVDSRVLIDPSELSTISNDLEPMLCVNSLMEIGNTDFASWRQRIQACFSAYYEKGSRQMMIRFEEGYRFAEPDPYHMTEALKICKKNSAHSALILSQLFREACEFAMTNEMQLLLNTDCDAASACALLSYTEKTVGLPTLYWTSRDPCVTDAVLGWQSLPHQKPVYMTLRLSHLPSREECASAIRMAAARYPVSRLCFITETDLILSEFAQARVESILVETLKKL